MHKLYRPYPPWKQGNKADSVTNVKNNGNKDKLSGNLKVKDKFQSEVISYL